MLGYVVADVTGWITVLTVVWLMEVGCYGNTAISFRRARSLALLFGWLWPFVAVFTLPYFGAKLLRSSIRDVKELAEETFAKRLSTKTKVELQAGSLSRVEED